VEATQKNYTNLVLPPTLLASVVLVSAIVVSSSNRIQARIFPLGFWGKSCDMKDIVGPAFLCSLATLMFLLVVFTVLTHLEIKRATKPLSVRVMVFALSYAIVCELDNF
jgi:hypothetical protein